MNLRKSLFMYRWIIKPSLDFIVALVAIVLLAPLLLIVYVILKLKMKNGAIFTQSRPGINGKIFKVSKFKTMLDTRDKKGELLPDDQRLTKLGSLIRKTSLDELPQLFNVLKGDMSFVGPRPLLPEYLPLYSERHARRHDVKPGITGWAQVNGRNALSWNDKFEHDVYYVEHQSFILDLKILFLTVQKVFKSEGITNGVDATTTRFTGKL